MEKAEFAGGIRKENKLIRKLVTGLADQLIMRRISIEVKGEDNLAWARDLKAEGNGLVITANHTSYADAAVLERLLQDNGFDNNIFVMGKRAIDNPVTRVLSKSNRTILVWPETIEPRNDREKEKRDKMNIGAMFTSIKALKAGQDIIVFPEGTRSRMGELQRASDGASAYLRFSDSIILPVGIAGLDKVMPVGRAIPRSADVVIKFGEPYATLRSDFKDLPREERFFAMSDYAMRKIASCLPQNYRGYYSDNI